jgi:hypothetical protein
VFNNGDDTEACLVGSWMDSMQWNANSLTLQMLLLAADILVWRIRKTAAAAAAGAAPAAAGAQPAAEGGPGQQE